MSLVARILNHPADAPALHVKDRFFSYGTLSGFARGLASAIVPDQTGFHRTVAIFASRSLTAYGGALAALVAGCGYVPLNPRFPTERTWSMLLASGSRVVIAGEEALEGLNPLLEAATHSLLVLLPQTEDTRELQERYPVHRFLGRPQIGTAEPVEPVPLAPESTAYLLFTSGSTGTPKGVPVSLKNMMSYLEYVGTHYPVSSEDRLSQTFDMTFDLSVHDIFLAWSAGACLYVLPEEALLLPGKFIRDHALTVWFSVPSTPAFMARARTLRPGVFPSLRLSLFCGEALPVSTAERWSEAAPNSKIVNLYGPTEATIAIAEHVFEPEQTAKVARRGITPIGAVFAGQDGTLVSDDGTVIGAAGQGELWLCGNQVTSGYLDNPEKTAQQYVNRSIGDGERWYRTGDLVERDEQGILHFLGRIDNQVKINGFRVELAEIEAALRKAAGVDIAIAVPFPKTEAGASGVVGIVVASGKAAPNTDVVIAACAAVLPPYMVPSRLVLVDTAPLNSNGKLDRHALAMALDDGKL